LLIASAEPIHRELFVITSPLTLTVIVPAFNEEAYLPATLAAVRDAADGLPCDVIVVDNESTDRTREIALAHGARVVTESVHNIGKVRNAGARAALGDVLVFVDADTSLPPALLRAIGASMERTGCIGGAVAVDYGPIRRRWLRWYLKGWAFWGTFFNMKQGAAQFCRRSAFDEIGGYDETIYMGEDVEFYWRLARHARGRGQFLDFLDTPRVVTSSRRFNRMSALKILVLTHPVAIRLSWKRRWLWKDWYERPIR
jgi:glycosyltransferase involved in cell wall biosynthesis